MIDILGISTSAQISGALLLIVLLLMYIAFYRKPRSSKR